MWEKRRKKITCLRLWGGTGVGVGGGGWALWRKTLLLRFLKTGSFWPRRNVTEVERRYRPANVRGLKLHTSASSHCCPSIRVSGLCKVITLHIQTLAAWREGALHRFKHTHTLPQKQTDTDGRDRENAGQLSICNWLSSKPGKYKSGGKRPTFVATERIYRHC